MLQSAAIRASLGDKIATFGRFLGRILNKKRRKVANFHSISAPNLDLALCLDLDVAQLATKRTIGAFRAAA